MDEQGQSFLETVASKIGVSDAALRLLLCIFLCYPGAIFYRKFVFPLPKLQNHLYFVVSGLALCFFNFGYGTVHSLVSVLATYLMIRFLPHSLPLRTASFLFHMTYILVGYYTTETDSYDIKWTTPHCVLVLRLIGLTFDVCDTAAKNKKEMDTYGIAKTPNLLEIAAYVYFPASFLAGPQFPYRLFERFSNKEFAKYEGFTSAALVRFGQGVLYLGLHQLCGLLASNETLVSDAFAERPFLVRMFLLGVWGRFTFYKYIAVWCMSEATAIRYGLTFKAERVEEDGRRVEDWSACANVNLKLFEVATEFNHYIQSFNINTNRWAARHIFKPLIFLGNKDLSQLLTLVFLAIWHGFHSGYYVTFLFEFVIVHIDRDVAKIVQGNATLRALFERPPMRAAAFAVQKAYTFVFLGWCIVPFGLLAFEQYWLAIRHCSYVGLWFFAFYPLVAVAARALFPPERQRKSTAPGEAVKTE